jgi:hypothetical protein
VPELTDKTFEPLTTDQIRQIEMAQKYLKGLERRDWWLWWSAVTVRRKIHCPQRGRMGGL